MAGTLANWAVAADANHSFPAVQVAVPWRLGPRGRTAGRYGEKKGFMGTWGKAVLADDFPRDTYDSYMDSYNDGLDASSITERLIAANAEAIVDPDEGPVFWLAMAKAQWDTGALDPGLYQRVIGIISSGAGLSRWEEAGPKALAQRRKVLEQCATQLQVENAKPKKRRPARVEQAVFRPGDCLALHLSEGMYGAAIVLAATDGPGSYGKNLVGTLNYWSSILPGPEDFEARRWLVLTHHNHKGKRKVSWCFRRHFRSDAALFERVGTTTLRESDPSDALSFCRWDMHIRQVELQYRWDAGDRA